MCIGPILRPLSCKKNILMLFCQNLKMGAGMGKMRKLRASMTVEASLVFPLFLFAFLNLMSAMEIYRLQSNMSAAMHSVAKQMAAHGSEYEALSGGSTGLAGTAALTVYAVNKVKAEAGENYFKTSPIIEGFESISWLRSRVMTDDDCIDLTAEYKVKPPISLMGFGRLSVYNRMCARAWTGYDVENQGNMDGESEKIVYVTPTGSVYHNSRACTYLELSIVSVDLDFIENKRNENREKYYPCESCGGGETSVVFITNFGNRYHSTLKCSGLKRTIMAVPISEVGARGACEKCGG